jgi:hypothetical protein
MMQQQQQQQQQQQEEKECLVDGAEQSMKKRWRCCMVSGAPVLE